MKARELFIPAMIFIVAVNTVFRLTMGDGEDANWSGVLAAANAAPRAPSIILSAPPKPPSCPKGFKKGKNRLCQRIYR